jgi:hypothetical protein
VKGFLYGLWSPQRSTALAIRQAAGEARPRANERPADKSDGEGPNEANAEISRDGRFWRQLTKSTVLSAQISTLDTSADLPSAYFPRRST